MTDREIADALAARIRQTVTEIRKRDREFAAKKWADKLNGRTRDEMAGDHLLRAELRALRARLVNAKR